jgi:hypothetical protein
MVSDEKDVPAGRGPARAGERAASGAPAGGWAPSDKGRSVLGGGEIPAPEQEEAPELLGERSDCPVPFGGEDEGREK